MNLIRVLEANLATLVLAMVGGLLAYVIGTTKTGSRLDILEAQSKVDQVFHECALRHFDWIERGKSGSEPCSLQ